LLTTFRQHAFEGILNADEVKVWKVLVAFLEPSTYKEVATAATTTQQQPRTRLSTTDVRALVAAGVAEPAEDGERLFTGAFTVDEGDKGRRRCIHHPRMANDMLRVPRLRLPSLSVLMECVGRYGYCSGFDYTSYYYQFEIPKGTRNYFCFGCEDGTVWRLTRLPMGVSFACAFANFVTSVVAARAAGDGVSFLTYIDNVIFFAHTAQDARAAETRFVRLSAELGLTIGDRASAATSGTFIGYDIDLTKKTIRNAERPTKKFLALDPAALVTCRDILRFFGALFSLLRLQPEVLARNFFLLKYYRRVCNKIQGGAGAHLDSRTAIWPSLFSALGTLTRFLAGRPVASAAAQEAPTLHIASDASDLGFGFSALGADGRTVHGGRRWDDVEQQQHINEKELRAVLLVARALRLERRADRIVWLIDNTTALHSANRRYSKIFNFNEILADIGREFPGFFACVRFVWTPSRLNPADGPSRLVSADTAPVWAEYLAYAQQQAV